MSTTSLIRTGFWSIWWLRGCLTITNRTTSTLLKSMPIGCQLHQWTEYWRGSRTLRGGWVLPSWHPSCEADPFFALGGGSSFSTGRSWHVWPKSPHDTWEVVSGCSFMAAKFEVFPTLFENFHSFYFSLSTYQMNPTLLTFFSLHLTKQTSTMGGNQLLQIPFWSLLKTPCY